MISLVRSQRGDFAPRARDAGIDLARALAVLGMLLEHELQHPVIQRKGVLWFVYGRSAPLFVLLAGVGVSLATRSPARARSRAMILARAPLLLVLGMVLSTQADGIILQSFALFFVVGACTARAPRRVLAALSAVCLVGGPLFLTVLRRTGELQSFGYRRDVGFTSLHDPLALLRGLLLEYYPAVTWLGFFFLGMLLGRAVYSADFGRRLFGWAGASAAVIFTVGWVGARAFGPSPQAFTLQPVLPYSWSGNWTTYGFSEAVGWALSSAAVALAVTGACIWLTAVLRSSSARALSPLVCLGSVSLTFYVLHGIYLDTLWHSILPHLTTEFLFVAATLAFWLVFAVAAKVWLEHFSRGPIETVLYYGALALTAPLRSERVRLRSPLPTVGQPVERGVR